MKTNFKRVLSVIVAFCLLITSALCLAGINSAADTPDTTTVYKWDFGTVETTNYLKNASGNIATNASEGNSVRYSFDYYVPSTATGNFTAKNNTGSFLATTYNGVVNQSTTGSSFLANGTIGHIDVTLSSKAGSTTKLYAGIGGAVGTIYVWNPKAWVDGTEVTVTGLSGTVVTTTYGDVPFETGAFDEISPATPAFKWSGATGQVAGTITGT